MILTFSKPDFVDKIQAGAKIHTIRKDLTNRWTPGRKIDFWLGNPRHVKSRPHCFETGLCNGIEYIAITRTDHDQENYLVTVSLDGKRWHLLTDQQTQTLAANDGLTQTEFYDWFLADAENFYGKIIHWTPYLYSKL